jgi:hypothetical protein
MNRKTIVTMIFACCLAGTAFIALRQITRLRRTVTIERWTDQIQMVSFGTDSLRLRSTSEIWNDLRYRWELHLLEDREVWRGFFWIRGSGQQLPGGGQQFRIGKNAWVIPWGDHPVPRSFLGFVLDETTRQSYGEMDKKLNEGETDESLAREAYEASRPATTIFVHTKSEAVHVTSWNDFLHQARTGSITVYWGDEYFSIGTLVHMQGVLLSRSNSDAHAAVSLTDHTLRLEWWPMYKENGSFMDGQPGHAYDIWGYFVTPNRGDPPELARLVPVLVEPVVAELYQERERKTKQ